MPELVDGMNNKPEHIIFVGNTSEQHVEAIVEYGRRLPEQCWMTALGYNEEKIRAFANYVKHLSVYFKSEAVKYGYQYYELEDNDFDASIETAIRTIVT